VLQILNKYKTVLLLLLTNYYGFTLWIIISIIETKKFNSI